MNTPSRGRVPIDQQGTDKSNIETIDPTWKSLYKIGGIAALLAGIVFRRNFGAEVSLFSATSHPSTALEWFTLLQSNRLLGLIFLNIFDIIDCALVGLMFLALYIQLRDTDAGYALIAAVLGFAGMAIYFASNMTFSMLLLSDQYASATTDAQRSMLLAAGEAILAINNLSGQYQGTGIYASFLLFAVAGLIFSFLMLQNTIFSRMTAWAGIMASIFDFAYYITLAFVPVISLFFVSAAGLFLMIWHIMVGRRLYLLSQTLAGGV